MLSRKSVFGIVAFGVWGLVSLGVAQETTTSEYKPAPESRPMRPFGGLFQGLGQTLFGEPVVREDRPATPSPTTQKYDGFGHPSGSTSSPRPSSLRTVPSQANALDLPEEPPADFGARGGDSAVPARRGNSAPTEARRVTGDNHSFEWKDVSAPKAGAVDAATPQRAGTTDTVVIESAPAGSSSLPPLHERLKGFRRSAFADSATSQPKAGSDAVSDPPTPRQPDRPVVAERIETPSDAPAQEPLLAPPRPSGSMSVGKTSIDSHEQPALTADSAAAEKRESSAELKSTPSPKVANESGTESGVLFARKSPNLNVQTLGPRRIVVGKEAVYEVTIQNSGEVAADDVVVFVGLPEWAGVASAVASVGDTRPVPQGRTDPFQWVVGRVDAKAREKLVLKIIVRQSRPFELAVRWDYKPAGSQATIEVQEPKLVMKLDGPREVFFGKREVYKLKLANTGTGPAENLAITLMPLSNGETQPVTHKLGTLAAGEQRTIEVELTARQAGHLTIQVEAHGEGSARAELAEKVLVRRAGLQVEMEGPTVQFVGTGATYKIRVRNPGDAVAKNVQVGINLPTGVKYLSGTEGAKLAPNNAKVQWTLERLDPGGERAFFVKCALALSGSNRLEAVSTADDELTASAEAVTQVEAMADLRLEVKDPERPVPLGEEAIYELRIRNRGTKTAENVEVMAYFSAGIEPTNAEGQPSRVSPGQVVFEPIAAIAPAAEVVLRVRARADAIGNHVFRAEVHCKPLGTRLVREETTHFYQEGPSAQQASQTPDAGGNAPGAQEPVRTADRRVPLPMVNPTGPSSPVPAGRR